MISQIERDRIHNALVYAIDGVLQQTHADHIADTAIQQPVALGLPCTNYSKAERRELLSKAISEFKRSVSEIVPRSVGRSCALSALRSVRKHLLFAIASSK